MRLQNAARGKLALLVATSGALAVVLPVAGAASKQRRSYRLIDALSHNRARGGFARAIGTPCRGPAVDNTRGVAIHALEAARPEHHARSSGFSDQGIATLEPIVPRPWIFHHDRKRGTTCLTHPSHLVNRASCFC
jgi:hypothetical protein